MGMRERSKKHVPELNENDEEPHGAEANASGRDGGRQKGYEKNESEHREEIQDFLKENNRQQMISKTSLTSENNTTK